MTIQRFIGLLNSYQNYIPRLSERPTPFFKLLKDTSNFFVPTNSLENFTDMNKLLENLWPLALKKPLKIKQLIVMSDASLTAAGYATMIEDDPNRKLQSERKTYALIAFGSITFKSKHHRRKCHYMQRIAFPYISHLLNLGTSCEEAPSQLSCSSTISNTTFPNENDSSSSLKCMQYCIAIQFRKRPCCRLHEHSSSVFIQNRSRHNRKA